jgi:hypothetical protein
MGGWKSRATRMEYPLPVDIPPHRTTEYSGMFIK